MKIKVIIGLIIALLIAMLAISASVKKINKQKAEIERLSDNQESLMCELEYHQLNDSVQYAQTTAMSLTIAELKQNNSLLASDVKTLTGRLKDAQNITRTDIQLKIDTLIQYKDIIRRDTVFKCIEYKDNYNYIYSCNIGDSASLNAKISVPLTLSRQLRYKHKFLFFRWGKQSDIVRAYTKNKLCHIKEVSIIDVR